MITSFPLISVVIPTLNAEKTLEDCLKSIRAQNYPLDMVEIIISDGGSTDGTCEIAKKYNAKIIGNKLKTGEAGKAAALPYVQGEYIALIDSDNILPTSKWFLQMIEPLINHTEVPGSEPWAYTHRQEDGFITRYCALIGMNDPIVLFFKNYDRLCLITNKWTEVEHEEKDFGEYIYAKFDSRGVPTIGANGTVWRTSFIKDQNVGDYLFDIDLIRGYIVRQESINFIKVKNSIIHTYCERDIKKFARKQRRRVKDFFYHKSRGDRASSWDPSSFKDSSAFFGIIKFILCCTTVLPLIFQIIKGYTRKPDSAWFFHILACELTLWEYAIGTINSIFKKSQADRKAWKQ